MKVILLCISSTPPLTFKVLIAELQLRVGGAHTHYIDAFSAFSGVARILKLPGHVDLGRPHPFSMACEYSRLWQRVTSMYCPRPYFSRSECSRFVELG